MVGCGSLRSDQAKPAAIPRIIGFVIMPFTVRKRRSLLETKVDFDAEVSEAGSLLADDSAGEVSVSAATAQMFQSGTVPIIISGAIQDCP